MPELVQTDGDGETEYEDYPAEDFTENVIHAITLATDSDSLLSKRLPFEREPDPWPIFRLLERFRASTPLPPHAHPSHVR